MMMAVSAAMLALMKLASAEQHKCCDRGGKMG